MKVSFLIKYDLVYNQFTRIRKPYMLCILSCEKICLPGFRQSDSNQPAQPQILAKSLNFSSSNSRYNTFKLANSKDADQNAQAGLCLSCSQTSEDRFTRGKAHISEGVFSCNVASLSYLD